MKINVDEYCTNIFSQSLGLMFKKKLNIVMFFPDEKKVYLHNFFVFYPIDVLILNKDKKIIEVKRNFKPFTFWNSKTKGKYVVELGFRMNSYRKGEKVKFIPDLDEEKLSKQTLKDIKQSRKEYRQGKYCTFEEIKKEIKV